MPTLMFYYNLIDSIVPLLIFRVYAILFLFLSHSQLSGKPICVFIWSWILTIKFHWLIDWLTDCQTDWLSDWLSRQMEKYTETKWTHAEQGHFQLSDLALHEFSQLSG